MKQDDDEECVMHSKSDNIEIITYDKAIDALKEFLESLIYRYEIGLEH